MLTYLKETLINLFVANGEDDMQTEYTNEELAMMSEPVSFDQFMAELENDDDDDACVSEDQ